MGEPARNPEEYWPQVYVKREEWERAEEARRIRDAAAAERMCNQLELLHKLDAKMDDVVAFKNKIEGSDPAFQKTLKEFERIRLWVDRFQGGLAWVGGVSIFLFGIVGWLGNQFILQPFLKILAEHAAKGGKP